MKSRLVGEYKYYLFNNQSNDTELVFKITPHEGIIYLDNPTGLLDDNISSEFLTTLHVVAQNSSKIQILLATIAIAIESAHQQTSFAFSGRNMNIQ